MYPPVQRQSLAMARATAMLSLAALMVGIEVRPDGAGSEAVSWRSSQKRRSRLEAITQGDWRAIEPQTPEKQNNHNANHHGASTVAKSPVDDTDPAVEQPDFAIRSCSRRGFQDGRRPRARSTIRLAARQTL